MAQILGGEIRPGIILDYNGRLCKVIKSEHVKPGKGGAFAQTEMSDIKTGTKLNVRFSTDEKVEKAFIENKTLTFSYASDDSFTFMDDTGEELVLNEKGLGINSKFLEAGCEVNGDFYNEQLIGLSWPQKSSVILKVVEAEKYLKGTTSTQKNKPALLENGITIKVPCYIETGQMIKVDPSTEEFVSIA